ncbi:MAG: hypothetical protein ACXW2A_18345, partial [Burkholderiales bacterium]
MPLRIYGDAPGFAGALSACSGAAYSICNADRLEPSELLRLERLAADHGHRDILKDAAVRGRALEAIESFFREAARIDPDWRFAYSSKVVLSIPGYQDLQKIFLLHAHFSANPRADILLLAPEPRLRHLFAELFAGASPAHGRALPAARAWARFGRTLLRALVNRVSGARARVLFFTLSSGVPRTGADAYFGNLAPMIAAQTPTRIVYLASGPVLRLPADGSRVPFEAFLSVFSVAGAWVKALFSASANASKPRGGDFAALHRYVRATEIRSGEYFMQRLYERGFSRMLARVSPEVLVYPFENRTWEKHLLGEARRAGVQRCVAYQHSSITPRHLAFHIESDEVRPGHLPDRVVTIGEHTCALLGKSAPALARRIVIGASLRTARETLPDASAIAVLVAISSSRNEALSLLKITYEAAKRVDVPFIVRTHPTIPVDGLFALFDWPPNVELSAGTSLSQDLSRVTLVAYSSSTVALEGMLYGRLPVFVDIGDLPSGDPIVGDHAFKFSVGGAPALAETLEHIRSLDGERLGALQNEARAFAESYLRAPTAAAVR